MTGCMSNGECHYVMSKKWIMSLMIMMYINTVLVWYIYFFLLALQPIAGLYFAAL